MWAIVAMSHLVSAQSTQEECCYPHLVILSEVHSILRLTLYQLRSGVAGLESVSIRTMFIWAQDRIRRKCSCL